MKAVTRPDWTKSAFEYDAYGRMLNEWQGDAGGLPFGDAGKAHVQMRYDDDKRLKRVRVRDDNRGDGESGSYSDSWIFYDGWGREVQLQKEWNAGAIQIVSTHYNSQGLVSDTTVPITRVAAGGVFHGSFTNGSLARQRSEHDALGRLRKSIHPDGSMQQVFYHRWGNYGPERYNERGHRTKTIQDGLGRSVSVVEKDGSGQIYATTSFVYDVHDRLLKSTDAKGNITTSAYDRAGNKVSMRDPDTGSWTYEHNALGQLTRQTDAREQKICFAYDNLGRMTRKDLGCDGSHEVGFEYDHASRKYAVGRQWKAWTSEGVTIETEFDNRGNAIFNHYAIPGTTRTWGIGRDFDQSGRLRKVAYPTGEVVTTSFDVAGNPRALCTPDDNYILGATYNERGAMDAVEYGSGAKCPRLLRRQWQLQAGFHRVGQHR